MNGQEATLLEWIWPILEGAKITLEIAIEAYVIAFLIGLAVATAKLGPSRVLRTIATVYTTLIRAVPELVLIILLYYAGQQFLNVALGKLGFGQVSVSGFATAVGVLAVVEGAYLAEIFRGAIQAIPRGHLEAADAYGMSRRLRFRRVVIPGMLPPALPSMYNYWLILLKDSALVSVVGFRELFFTSEQAAASTRQYFLYFAVAGALYLLMTMASNVLVRWLERRVSRHRRLPGLGH